ncbi:MAG: hypothetical protein CMO30_16765 [Tistrella sp.]|nr:hypothetical protein [Tistrella sp.]MBA76923.1 hypothetical protein [Tistrella sp.]|tara:strand:+ start:2803 stop:4179 length:1377 start_codon:yes stop_codon:yes gene_type:complete
MVIFTSVIVINAFSGAITTKAPVTVGLFCIVGPLMVFFYYNSYAKLPCRLFLGMSLVSFIVSAIMMSGMYSAVFNFYYFSAVLFLAVVVRMALSSTYPMRSLIVSVYAAVNFVMYSSLVYYVLIYLPGGVKSYGGFGYSFFFDDKSHYTIFLGFYIYMTALFADNLRHDVVGGRAGGGRVVLHSIHMLFALVITLILSSSTFSRLIVFFLPLVVFVFYFMIDAAVSVKIRGPRRRILTGRISFMVYFCLAVFIAFIIIPMVIENATVRRITRLAENGADAAFESHILLIKLALTSKFESISNFIWGVGLGNFQIEIRDNGLLQYLTRYKGNFSHATGSYLPVHSVWATIFIEMNIFFFSMIMMFVFYIFLSAIFYLNIHTAGFVAGIFLSSMFYTTINEPFYFIMWAVIIMYSVSWAQRSKVNLLDLLKVVRTDGITRQSSGIAAVRVVEHGDEPSGT